MSACGCNYYVPYGIEYCPMHQAAPELLDVLKAAPAANNPPFLNSDEFFEAYDGWRKLRDAAIAKAEAQS